MPNVQPNGVKMDSKMSAQDNQKALLPGGFEDLLPEEAAKEHFAIAAVMGVFSGFGYARVKPPLAEFEDSLLADGPGAALAADTFRVMDPLTRRMMGLRSDVTPQIARIALSRLAGEVRPLRMAYANDVIRMQASQQRTQRQFTQAGCEMVGTDTAQSDIEVAVVALHGLAALGLPAITIDFALPRIFDAVLGAAGAGEQEIDDLRSQLAGSAQHVFVALGGLNLPDDAKAALARLRDVVLGVEAAVADLGLVGVSVTIDPLETKGFEYHSGVAFTLFAQGARGEIGRGGRYMICDDGREESSAAGFTLYMDTIRQVITGADARKMIAVPADVSWQVLKDLQEQGWVVCRDVAEDGAVDDGCTHRYNNGQIEEIK
jgi:ATP phosphoribosyltransferase regulatory subunit